MKRLLKFFPFRIAAYVVILILMLTESAGRVFVMACQELSISWGLYLTLVQQAEASHRRGDQRK
jgi:hypothetical protein